MPYIEDLKKCPRCGGELRMEVEWDEHLNREIGTGDIVCQTCSFWAEHGDMIDVSDYVPPRYGHFEIPVDKIIERLESYGHEWSKLSDVQKSLLFIKDFHLYTMENTRAKKD